MPIKQPARAKARAKHTHNIEIVGNAVLGHRGKRHDPVNTFRKLEIETLLRARRGAGRVGMGEEELFLLAIARHLVALADEGQGAAAVTAWCRAKCPKLSARRGGKWLAEFATSAQHLPFYSAQAAGNLLALTPEERRTLGITTMWVQGWTQADYDAHRCGSKASHERKRRASRGAVPRNLSIEALAPWKAENMSRPEWYRCHSKAERDAIVKRLRQIRGHQPEPYGSEITTNVVHETVSALTDATGGVTPPPRPQRREGGRGRDASPVELHALGRLRRAALQQAHRRGPEEVAQ